MSHQILLPVQETRSPYSCVSPSQTSLTLRQRQCLPSIRPLVTLIADNSAYRSFAAKTSRTFQSSQSTALKSNHSKNKNYDSGTFDRLEEHDGNRMTRKDSWRDQEGHTIIVHGGRGHTNQNGDDIIEMERLSDGELPKGAIRVKTEILLSSSKRLDYNDRLF